MGEVKASLPSDVFLVQKALGIEMEKRAAILSADGRELQRKTRESEEVLRQMGQMAASPKPLSPEAIRLAEKLREESGENQRLLEKANHTIHRLLTEMGEKESTYDPHARKQQSTGGLLLDASV